MIASALLPSRLAAECEARGLPIVLFNRVQTDPGLNAVCADNYGGGTCVAERFLAQGHKRIGFVDALARHAVEEVAGDFDYGVTRRVVTDLLARSGRPTTLFCANDLMAFAAIDSASAAGMTQGDDLAIVGYDDVPMARWESYQLTTVSQNKDALVQETLAIIAAPDPHSKAKICVVPSNMIVRKTG